MRATRVEALLGLSFVAASVVVLLYGLGGLTTMFAIGFAMQGAVYLCAPAVALVAAAERDVTSDRLARPSETFAESLAVGD